MTSCRKEQSQVSAVLSHDALDSSEKIKATLMELFPDKKIPVYMEANEVLLAVVEDFDSDRFLLVRSRGWDGLVKITRDGAEVTPPFSEVSIKQYGGIIDENGSRDDRSRTVSDHLGFWIPLSRTETLNLSADLIAPESVSVTLNYSTSAGWSGSINRTKESKNDQQDVHSNTH